MGKKCPHVTLSDQRERRVPNTVSCKRCFEGFFGLRPQNDIFESIGVDDYGYTQNFDLYFNGINIFDIFIDIAAGAYGSAGA